MGIEIERRFLAANDDWRKDISETRQITQGYLIAKKELSIRARVDERSDGTVKSTLTIKSFISDTQRHEFEYDIPLEDAKAIIKTSASFVIDKKRHIAKIDGFAFEIDEYLGDNDSLTLIELEMADDSIDYPKPSWLGQEVTMDGRYSNAYLSHHPYNEWSPDEKTVIKPTGGSL